MTTFRKLLLSSLACAALGAGAARAERLPMQNDFDRCALRAVDQGNRALSGKYRMQILVRNTGRVYAAFAHSEEGVTDRKLQRCIAQAALRWELHTPVAHDYWRGYPLTFILGGSDSGGMTNSLGVHSAETAPSVFMPRWDDAVPPAPINVRAAQETLELNGDATMSEQGTAYLAIHKYPDAIASFRSALEKDPNDAQALRGMAQALAESGGDAQQARAAAEKLISLKPESVVGFEAMTRVCLAQRDDACAVGAFQRLAKLKDAGPRGRIINDELLPGVKDAGQRLQARAAEAKTGTAQAQPQGEAGAAQPQAEAQAEDPCARETSEEKQALCVVDRCVGEGSREYAKQLSDQNKVEYAVGDWRSKPVGNGRLLVTRPIEPKAGPGTAAKHDALWLVKIGDQLVMQPSNSEAKQITLSHNRCAKRVTSTQ